MLAPLLSGQIVVTTGTNVALIALGLFTGSLAAHLLGPLGRGQLAAIQLWPMTAAALGSGGLLEAITYFCGRDRDHSREVVSTGLGLLALLTPVLIVAGILGMSHLLRAEPADVIRRAQLYMFIVPILFAVNVGYGALRGRGDFRLWNPWRLSQPLGYALVLVIAIFVPSSERVSVVSFGFMAVVAAHLAFAGWIFKHRLDGAAAFRKAYVRPLTRYGALSLNASMPAMVNQRMDQLVMGAFLPPRLLGLYAVGVTWSMAVTPLSNAFSHVILPRLASAGETGEANERLAWASRIAAAAGVIVGGSFLIVTPLAVRIVFGSAFTAAIPATLVLVVAAMLLGMNQFLEEAVRGLGRPGLAAVAELAGIGITIPGLYVLLPRWGILGAAVTSLAAYAVVLAFLTVLVCRYTGLSPGALFLLRRVDLSAIHRRLRSLSS